MTGILAAIVGNKIRLERNPALEKAVNRNPALEAMIWLQNCNSQFESENGMTMDQVCFRLIEDGNYQPVLRHILAIAESVSRLPADSEAALFLYAYIGKYLDAMEEAKGRED
jgi:hypothetical protein